ncbi:MAG: PQQ-dependent sugar dehydrogenase [Chloroflexi bacterium]|nr:PQQ-dependent sugar dehydrogenase [Chloroflexota bacterium]MCI0645636.1 PQQ-dependent sugar dehydrogenase [Chloroflexota bacterium]MCI0725548.1 PQQ-dependent sugar dehydrogenase [Chloroflexota bacterium]
MTRAGSFLVIMVVLLVACGAAGEETTQTRPPAATGEAEIEATAGVTEIPATEPATAAPPEETESEPATAAPPANTARPAATDLPAAGPVTEIQLAPVVEGFDQPLYLTHASDERLFVVEQPGTIWVVADGEILAEPFLDIREQVGSEASEQGLLGLAFDPDYASNGAFYVNYTDNQGDTVVARYQVSDADPNQADPNSEEVVLAIDQPYGNHNGGQLQFGPDGYLYVGMGDGGSGGDPHEHGQNPATLLGALLRLDVAGGEPYAIPAGNPFAAGEDGAPEVWAIGLRNPWRFSFDRLTEDLYVADVGQNAWEEVNFLPAGSPGGVNFGWNILEGTHCYRQDDCDTTGLLLPVAEYSHDDGCSVTGGYVYRGSQFPALSGNYFFADYCSGLIWSLFRGLGGDWTQNLVLASGLTISSFGEDAAGELYVVDHAGQVLQIQP